MNVEAHDRRFIVLMLAPIFLFLVFFYGYPTALNLYYSLTDLSLLGMKEGGTYVGLEHYADLLTSKDFYRTLWNTLFWLTGVSVVIRLVLGLGLALLLNSATLKRYRLTTISRLLLLVPWATPPIVAVVVWRWLLDGRQGMINKFLMNIGVIDEPVAFLANVNTVWPALITIIVWNTLPLVTLTFLAGLQSVPDELHEAAEMDGAGPIHRFFHVTLPHLMPSIVIMGLLLVFWTFNNFIYVWLATGAGPGLFTNVLATDIYIKGFVDFHLGYSSAVGMVMAGIMAIFGVIYFRLVALREFKDVL
ncbi:carbohydrate ABC transporter permease [Oceaniglobus trochenteri]|uniref:carbohydrate ABC transporter permease n=1 Tax=Oceaniglobus trochenteri TaxID=2763260 RepID=UPI001CFFF7C2|nr:sugar ABC transporter permease [Oceaniglobus trochenteri]